jgi:hypothetical protein
MELIYHPVFRVWRLGRFCDEVELDAGKRRIMTVFRSHSQSSVRLPRRSCGRTQAPSSVCPATQTMSPLIRVKSVIVRHAFIEVAPQHTKPVARKKSGVQPNAASPLVEKGEAKVFSVQESRSILPRGRRHEKTSEECSIPKASRMPSEHWPKGPPELSPGSASTPP